MLFFLRKLTEALLLPIGISGLLTIAGVIFRRRWIAVAGVALLCAFGMQAVGRSMLEPLERVYAPKTVAAAPNADAIVLLNGTIVRGVTPPGVQWGGSSNRFFTAVDLALAGKAKLIVISAGASLVDGQILRQVAIRDGIPPDRIVVTPRVLTTEDEARAVSEIPNIRSILLVSSAFHMPRAVLLFRARGLDVSPFPTDQRVLGQSGQNSSQFIPGAGGLRESEDAMREYYGLVLYHLLLWFRPLAPLRP
jgi:uncharacterized SAM-binding protein YcdF (DUF218 family)